MSERLSGLTSTLDGEIALWQADLAIDRRLRRHERSRQAATTAHRAAHTLTAAATRSGTILPDTDVTRVARSAVLISRGIVAGIPEPGQLDSLLDAWSPFLESVGVTGGKLTPQSPAPMVERAS